MEIVFLLTTSIVSFLISLLIAKKMVESRCFLAKDMPVGKDSVKTITHLQKLAEKVMYNGFITCEEDENITYNIRIKNSIIQEVVVENERTSLKLYRDRRVKVDNKAFSKIGAIIFIAIIIWMVLSPITLFINNRLLWLFVW